MYKIKRVFLKGGALLAVAFILSLFFASDTFASTLSMSISSSSLALTMLPNSAEGNFASSDDLGISISLTGPGGYTLGIKAASSNANARNLVNSSANTTLNTISSVITPANYADNTYAATNSLNNTWGYLPSKYDSVANTSYRPAPDADGDIIDATSEAGDGNTVVNYTISIGARADLATKPGSYSNTFVIIAVANIPNCNPGATSIDNAVCMQDMNDNVINSMTIDAQYKLYDNRDWKQYYIARMKDGKVWMTQNLDLDLVSDTDADNYIALTSENTDLNEYGSNGHTTSYGYSCSNISSSDCKGAGEVITWVPSKTTYAESEYASWANSTTTPESINREYYMHATSIGGGFGYYSKSQCESNASAELCAHSYAGNYYNFSAATATNDTSTTASSLYDDSYYSMPNSVCPAGWRLPTGYTGNNTYSEANILWVQENVIAGYATSTNSTINYIDVNNAFTILFRSPLYYANTGYKYSNGNGYSSLPQLATGTIWNKDNSFYFQISNTYARPTSISVRSNGYNIRCIARQTNTGGSTTVTFNKNADDATGTMSNQTYNANTINTLPSNSFTRSGYAFNSWNTEPDGSGKSYSDADKYYAMSGNTTNNATLYAQWDKLYTITFNIGSNATGINFDGTTYANNDTAQAIEGKSYIISGVYGTKYAFNSWATTVNGTIENSNYQTTHYVINGDSTLTVTGQAVTTEIKSLTIATCPTTPSPVYDERDDEVYWVAKLSDDKCWMLDNLRLDPTNATVAANLSTSNTSVNSDGLNYLLNGGGTTPYTASAISTSWFSYNLRASVSVGFKNQIAPVFSGPGSGKLGVYYNYCAASAGTYCYGQNTGYDVPGTNIDSPYSLCPAGWRMPTGYGSGNEYSYINGNSSSKLTLSLLLSGTNSGGANVSYLGQEGHFWSSTFSGSYDWIGYGSARASNNGISFSGGSASSPGTGRSMRCVMPN